MGTLRKHATDKNVRLEQAFKAFKSGFIHKSEVTSDIISDIISEVIRRSLVRSGPDASS